MANSNNVNFSSSPSQTVQQKASQFLTVALTGGTAAVISKTATAPIERIKLLLQVHQ